MEQQPDLPQPAEMGAATPPATMATMTTTISGRTPQLKVSNCKESDEPSVRKDREEWSEAAISTLIDAYTAKYGQLNGKGLRSKDWAEVVETVNTNQKSAKTVEHCRNKMDTLTKRYKSEKKNKLSGIDSSWPWYDKMEIIRGCSPGKSVTAAAAAAAAAVAATNNSSKVLALPPGKEKMRSKRGSKRAVPSNSEELSVHSQGEKNKESTTYSSVKPVVAAPSAPPPPPPGLFSKVDGVAYKPEVSSATYARMDSSAPHQSFHIPAAIPAWQPSLAGAGPPPPVAFPQVAAAVAAAAAREQQAAAANSLDGTENLSRSIMELAGSLRSSAGNLVSSINGFTEVYARIEIAKMEMLKELELKRMQVQLETAEILSRKRRRGSSSDPE